MPGVRHRRRRSRRPHRDRAAWLRSLALRRPCATEPGAAPRQACPHAGSPRPRRRDRARHPNRKRRRCVCREPHRDGDELSRDPRRPLAWRDDRAARCSAGEPRQSHPWRRRACALRADEYAAWRTARSARHAKGAAARPGCRGPASARHRGTLDARFGRARRLSCRGPCRRCRSGDAARRGEGDRARVIDVAIRRGASRPPRRLPYARRAADGGCGRVGRARVLCARALARTPAGRALQGTTPYGTTPYGTTPNSTTPNGTTPNGTTPNSTTPNSTTPAGTGADGRRWLPSSRGAAELSSGRPGERGTSSRSRRSCP